jgi:putative addiction module antidote
MIPLKVTTIGNSTGVILPKEALAKLNVTKGDTLMLTETPEGFVLTPYDVTFERQMNVAEKIANRYRDALRELAK